MSERWRTRWEHDSKFTISERSCARNAARAIQLIALPICCLLMFGCAGVQTPLDPAGPQSDEISRIWWLMFFVLSAIFLIVMIMLAIAVWRRRSLTDSDQPEVKAEPAGEHRRSQVVTAAVVITVLVLFVLLISSFLTGRSLHSLAATDSKPLTIDITGQQWWWQVKYENDLPSQIVTTANEIHVPVGRVVHFKLRSNDVIHSFWVPNLHGKTDLVPGHVSDTWIRVDRLGVFRGQCAEFCGHQHAHMALRIIAESEADYERWYSTQLQSALAPSNTQQARGQQVFLSSTCIMCHRIQGTDAGGAVGPDLTHVASRQTIAAATLENSRENLAHWILDSQSIKPGNHMPPNPLNNDDLQALLDYLQSLN
ncbi:MAG TPA: cytochrome c oxidase subunit II [Pyrinomonadaceae bacterium]|nr:cytochrome c oxidase subunit II [Pyrinomonadaceae bacterium]